MPTLIARRLTLALALVVVPKALCAQSATMSASAAVATPITVTGLAPLAFGFVVRGVNKTIAWNAASSGRMSVTGFATSQLALTFTLPGTLTNGANTLPINTYRIRFNGTNSTTGATAVAVTNGVPVRRNLVAGSLFVFVGARVQPSVSQTVGPYSGAVVLSAAYTGL